VHFAARSVLRRGPLAVSQSWTAATKTFVYLNGA
jgi:hypothetical protein